MLLEPTLVLALTLVATTSCRQEMRAPPDSSASSAKGKGGKRKPRPARTATRQNQVAKKEAARDAGLARWEAGADAADADQGSDSTRAKSAVASTKGVGCIDFVRLRKRDGTSKSCYPYRCRQARCLSGCRQTADCAGTQKVGPLTEGWPLKCVNGECVPLSPEHVRRQWSP